jgi:hypothetical protein
MAKERSVRIGFYLLAGVTFVAPAMLANTSADAAHAHHHRRLGAAHFVSTNVSVSSTIHSVSSGTQKTEDHAVPGTDDAPAKGGRNSGRLGQPGPLNTGSEGTQSGVKDSTPGVEVTSPNVHMKDLGPVETRISVEPPLHGLKPGKTASAKVNFKLVPRHGLHVRPNLVRATVIRNAIGVPIHPQANDNRGGHTKGPDQTGSSGAPKLTPGNGGAGLAGLESRPQVSNPFAAKGLPSPGAAAMNHSSIGGMLMLRPAITPGAIGGPVKNVVGSLNGTTFRQRHP